MADQHLGQDLDAAALQDLAQLLQALVVLLGAAAEQRGGLHALGVQGVGKLDGDLVRLAVMVLGADKGDGQTLGHVGGLQLLGRELELLRDDGGDFLDAGLVSRVIDLGSHRE